MSNSLRLLVVLLGLVSITGVASGQATLAGVDLGEHAAGPEITEADLEGRVVLFEYWGVNCGPCVANIPHVTDLQEKYPRHRFVVVANHCQGGGAANAGNLWKSKAGRDIVSVIDRGRLPGANVSGIPRCFLFDHEGYLVWEGHPARVDRHVAEVVRRSPGFLVAGRDYAVFAREAALIGRMQGNLSAALRRLRPAAEDASADGHAEAKFIVDRVTEWADDRHAALSEDPYTRAAKTSEEIDRMVNLLRGDASGERFVELERQLRGDAKFREELAAARMLRKVQHYAGQQGLPSDDTSPRTRRAKATIARSVAAIKSRYPDTHAAAQAEQYARSLGL